MKRRLFLGGGAAGMLAAAMPWTGLRASPEAALLAQVARARRQAGLRRLVAHAALARTADEQALHMMRTGAATHLDADGREPDLRARRAGYDRSLRGETLAETFDAPAETVALWLSHDSTRDVLLDPGARDVGLAMRHGRDGRQWWSLVLGA